MLTKTRPCSRRYRTRRTLFAGLAAVGLLAAGCGGGATASGSPGKTLTIPYIASTTGPAAGYKADFKVPPKLVKKMLGKTNGQKVPNVKFKFLEAGLSPSRGVRDFRQAMKSDPVVVMGGGSTVSTAVAPLANRAGVPFIATGASKVSIAAKNRPWVFTPWASPQQVQGAAVKRWLKHEPQIKRVVMLENVQDAASKTQGDAAAAGVKAAGKTLAGVVSFNTGTTDFAPLISKAKSLKPDGIIVASTPPEASSIDKAIKQSLGARISVYQIQNTLSQGFFTTVGAAAKGNYAGTTFYAGASSPGVQKYVTSFKKLSGGVRPTYAEIYDGFQFLTAALKKVDLAGKSTKDARKALDHALRNTCIDPVVGNKECFNSQGYVKKQPLLLRFDAHVHGTVVGPGK